MTPPLQPIPGELTFHAVDPEAGIGLRVFREFPIAKDVCDAVGISEANYRRAILELEDYMLGPVVMVKTAGGPQPMKTVTEAGFYALTIAKGKSDWAQSFRRKVLTEILPAIRKTGAYVAPGRAEIAVSQRFLPPPEPVGIEGLLIELLMEVLAATRPSATRAGQLVHGRTIYDVAKRDDAFREWMGHKPEDRHRFSAFMTNLSHWFARPLTRPLEGGAAYVYSVAPSGFGRDRLYVITVRRVEAPSAGLHIVPQAQAVEIVADALRTGGEVKVS